MTARRAAVAAAIAAVLLCCCGGVVIGGNTYLTSSAAAAATCGSTTTIGPTGPLPDVGGLSEEQRRNAAVIIAVGQQRQIPPRGWVIAIGTALQESTLRNLGHLGDRNDHDSLGLFQQRPSQGWGTPEQILDPVYSTGKFYDALLKIPNWAALPLTEAAQAVQRSAYPDAYAKHEPLATAIVNALADGAGRAAGDATDLRCATGADIAASGWTVPLRGPMVSGFRTVSRPDHHGVDIGVPKGTPIVAASAGIVQTAVCNASTNNCDVDGSPSVAGCGWYVDILHAGGIITRYCHMLSKPHVTVGQHVAAGQEIGRSGSSGNSSGPHLHFEVHERGDASRNGATDPVAFMASVGAPIA